MEPIKELAIMAEHHRRRRKRSSFLASTSSSSSPSRKEIENKQRKLAYFAIKTKDIIKMRTASSNCFLIFCIFISTFVNQLTYIQQTSATNTTTDQAMVHGTNMSQTMSLNQASVGQFMTNTSLLQNNSSNNNNNKPTTPSSSSASQQHSAQGNLQAASSAGKTASKTNPQAASYNNANSNKHQSVKGAANNRQQVVGSTNSPAFNSRLKSPPLQSMPSAGRQEQNHMMNHNGKKLTADNQMAADDIHETQAFMTINSATVNSGGGGGSGGSPNNSNSNQATDNSNQISNVSKAATLNHQLEHKGLSSSSTSASRQDNSNITSGGTSSSSKEVPKFLQHPYMDTLSQKQLQKQLEQQRYLQLAELEQQQYQAQLEKPNGYSYDQTTSSLPTSTSYTHTSQLNPVKQEVLLAEKLRQKQQRQQQYHNHHHNHHLPSAPSQSDRSASHSIFGLSVSEQQQQQLHQQQRSLSPFISHQQQIEQLTISGKSTPPATVQPQFNQHSIDSNNNQNLLYSSASASSSSGSSLKPPVAHGNTFSMLPPGPHISITGTASNPCKPPHSTSSVPGAASDLTQSLVQLLNSNDVATSNANNHPQALPNFSSTPKYVRVGEGTRLRSGLIFKVIRADSLTDCELACTRASSLANNNIQDTCRSFNYRAYFAAENCELSRHDWRQLKLEDSAQFEQHTQFDFYALENPPQQSGTGVASAALMMTSASNSVQQQHISYSLFPEADCLDVSQSCTQDGMEFTLRTNEPFNGRIYTYGFYDSCFTDGEGSTSSLLRISRSNGFPRCGTQQIGDLMTNIVVVQFNDFVQTTRDKKYNLTCYFSGPGEAVVTSNYLDTKIDERSHPIQIEHLPPQNVITSNVHLRVLYRGQPTNTIAVGDLLTFRLETRHNNNNINQGHGRASSDGSSQQQQQLQSEIFATNVIAKDPYSGKQVQLIDSRGCPIDPVNVFPELQRTPDGALEAEFYAFKIPDSNFLIFQATVRTCKAPCEPVICQSASPQSINLSNHINSVSGTKGSYLMAPQQQQLHSAALLQHNAHHLSNPSWGKRRRKKRLVSSATYFDDDNINNPDDLNLGESIEHIIPVRMHPAAAAAASFNDAVSEDTSGPNSRTPRQMQVVTTVKRPELAEAEEEVKEMFRVYLSRAEMNNRNNKQEQLVNLSPVAIRRPPPLSADDVYDNNNNNNNGFSKQDQNHYAGDSEKQQQALFSDAEIITTAATVCITQSGYYILLFTVISLTMVMLSILAVSFYITKRAKFSISDSIASSSTIHF